MTEDIEQLGKLGKIPTLGIVRLGQNPGDISYEKKVLLRTAIN